MNPRAATMTLAALLLACDDAPTAAPDASTRPDASSLRDASSSDASDAPDASGAPSCVAFFGAPAAKTGLGDDRCGRACDCGEPWELPDYGSDEVAEWRSWTLTTSLEPLAEDPYAQAPPAPAPPGSVCAIVPDPDDPKHYALETFPSRDDASAQGALVTHRGACGLCSTLEDLATYVANPDLTGPVRECGLKNLSGDAPDAVLSCLEDLGFTPACATIWAFNTEHTREKCLGPCIAQLNRPYNRSDGSLNDCLQCDEDESGAVFKALAGRTRRNSGLASAICRPCDTVFRVVHDYAP